MQYLLLLLTLGIWGSVLYRAWLAYGSSGIVNTAQNNFSVMKEQIAEDPFSISAGYRDPFLEKAEEENHVVMNNNSFIHKKSVVKETPKEIPWPQVNYAGMIRNQESGKLLALVLVNGKSSMLTPGELFEEIRVGKIFKDSVEVIFNNQNRYVRK